MIKERKGQGMVGKWKQQYIKYSDYLQGLQASAVFSSGLDGKKNK